MTPDPLKAKPETLGFEREAKQVIEECWEQTELSKPKSAKKIIALALQAAFSKGIEEGYRKGKQAGGMDEAIGCQEHSMKAFDNGWNACKLEAAKVAKEEKNLYKENSIKCQKCRNYVGEAADFHSAMACDAVAARIRALKPAKGESRNG